MSQKTITVFCFAALFVGSFLPAPQIWAQEPTGLKYVPDTAFAAATLRFKDAMAEPSMQVMPHELLELFGKKEFGVNMKELDRISFLTDPIEAVFDPPKFAIVIEFTAAQQPNGRAFEHMDEFEIDGRRAWSSDADDEKIPALIEIDDKTYFFTYNSMVDSLLDSTEESKLITLIKAQPATDHFNLCIDLVPIRGFIKASLPPADELAPMISRYLQLPDLISTIQFRQRLGENPVSEITITTDNEDDALKLEKLLVKGVGLAKHGAVSGMAYGLGEIDSAYQEATYEYSERLAETIKEAIKNSRTGTKLVIDLNQTQKVSGLAVSSVLVGVLLPAVQQVRAAARRTTSLNQLRQLCLASHNFEAANRHWPTQAICDANGKPLLSWRVAILPFLGEQALYDEFHLDEPWDSDHNITLLDRMPPAYVSNLARSNNETVFLAAAGKEMAMNGKRELQFTDVTDGMSNTIVIVEADQEAAVPWTKPADLEVDLENPLKNLGNLQPTGFNVAMMDGSVRFFGAAIDEEIIRGLFTYAGGEDVSGF